MNSEAAINSCFAWTRIPSTSFPKPDTRSIHLWMADKLPKFRFSIYLRLLIGIHVSQWFYFSLFYFDWEDLEAYVKDHPLISSNNNNILSRAGVILSDINFWIVRYELSIVESHLAIVYMTSQNYTRKLVTNTHPRSHTAAQPFVHRNPCSSCHEESEKIRIHIGNRC